MKKTDIAAVILISVITTLIAYFIGNSILGDPNEQKVVVKYMDVIEAAVAQPDPEVFSPNAENPTVEIYIGNCTGGQIWDVTTQSCIEPQAPPADNPDADPENSETGE